MTRRYARFIGIAIAGVVFSEPIYADPSIGSTQMWRSLSRKNSARLTPCPLRRQTAKGWLL